jgi:hypothetical protein
VCKREVASCKELFSDDSLPSVAFDKAFVDVIWAL